MLPGLFNGFEAKRGNLVRTHPKIKTIKRGLRITFSGRTLTLYGCNPRFNPQHWVGRGFWQFCHETLDESSDTWFCNLPWEWYFIKAIEKQLRHNPIFLKAYLLYLFISCVFLLLGTFLYLSLCFCLSVWFRFISYFLIFEEALFTSCLLRWVFGAMSFFSR